MQQSSEVSHVLTHASMLRNETSPLMIVISNAEIRKHFAQLSRQLRRVVIDTTHNVFATNNVYVTGIFFKSPTMRGAFLPYAIGRKNLFAMFRLKHT